MFLPKRNIKGGFTLVELLVTISIFVILTGIVLFNQTKFDSTILLTNLAYDTALTIRQAQTYGINIKQFDGNFVPYGVHFETGANNKSFILFADKSYDLTQKNLSPFSSSVITCLNEYGCVNRYSIKRGNFISKICVTNNGVESCGVKKLDILFQRPNPDAIIFSDGSNGGTKAIITLSNPNDNNSRTVEVQSNGLIQIK